MITMEVSALTWTLMCLVLLLLLVYVFYMSSTHMIFRKLGIPGPTPWPVFGNFVAEARAGIMNYQTDLYFKYKHEKVYGFYRGKLAILTIRDLDMIRDICVKNFNDFVNRTTFSNDEPFKNALTEAKDEHWKNIRTTISPTFNTVRLKRMYRHIESNTRQLLDHLKNKQERNEPVELKEVLSHFTMDVIASTGFGVQTNSLGDPNNQFIKESERIMASIGRIFLISTFLDFLKPVLTFFGIASMPRVSLDFFSRFVDVAIQERKLESSGVGSRRHDFLQLMMEAEEDKPGEENDNMTEEEARVLNTHRKSKPGLSLGDMQGQAIIFTLAGYETVSSVLTFTLFLLTMNPECLQKAQAEVDEVLGRKFPDYDDIQSLKYLDMCLNEAIRMFPPGFFLDRKCNADVEIQGVRIPKGVTVLFPMGAIHRDPDLWPEPDKFVPERFTPENKSKRHPYAHLPFGQGPRNCIGMRLALLETKVAVAAILQKFSLVRCEQSKYPVVLEQFRLAPKDGAWVKLEART
ncbi:cytochrome P450 3A24 [Aplysia californica]|uniref:Cytochrome P450 3A24 n=1 Tax=Aplysia californica TaxID=6500 RepID=A0ABM0KA70_APLCA|nr:cytochrome P450 3A24 [Aplysia californica]XP_005112641.1 cytochrome P450 3A24 [Aplysia californica]